MLLDEELDQFSEEMKNAALLLLATYRKLLLAVKMDLGTVEIKESIKKRRYWGKVDKQDKLVIAGKLQLKCLDVEKMVLFFNTYKFLNQLPETFVKQIINWAPPVVSGSFLIENVLAGYIAQQILPLEEIKVRKLCKSLKPYFHLADFFMFLPQLEELYQKNKNQIVRIAPTTAIAISITDFKKAWVSRVRQVK